MRLTDLRGRRVVVWGAGVEGKAAVDACRRHGIPVTQVVTGEDEPLDSDAARELAAAEVVVKSPGVPVASPLYRHLEQQGVGFTSGTDLWMGDHAHLAVGVTGSKGKSTTASLMAAILEAAGRPVVLAGNVGVPLLDRVDTTPETPSTVFVLELSSYQCQSLTRSPRVACVTSLFPEHLPWHGGEESYYRDKLNLVAHGPEVVVGNGRDARVRAMLPAVAPVPVVFLDDGDIRVDAGGDLVWADGSGGDVLRVPARDLALPGRHNAQNMALALLTLVEAGLVGPGEAAAVREVLTGFAPLAHRLETVPSNDGRHWVDDGLATAPEAVAAALGVFEGEEVALVLGGSDRGLDFTHLADYLRTRTAPVHVLCIGAAGERFVREATGTGHDLRRFAGLEEALTWARSDDNPASVVLLSPGAPSFDAFANYAERSRRFREIATA